MSPHRPISVRTRLVVTFGAVVGAIALFVFWFFPNRFEEQALGLLEEEVRSTATVTGQSVQTALFFAEYTTAKERLALVAEDERILLVEVRTPEGRIVAEVHRDDPDARSVEGVAPVRLNDRDLGTVRVVLSAAGLTRRAAQMRRTVGLVSLFIMAFGLFAVIAVSVRVSAPLVDMVETARRIAGGDREGRAHGSTVAEVDALASTFNVMVDHLEASREEADAARVRTQRILQSLPGLVGVFDRAGDPLFTSGDAWPGAEAMGLPSEVLAAVHCCIREEALVEVECQLDFPGGPPEFFHFAVNPIRSDAGGVGGVVAYGTRITELRRTQEALAESEGHLRRAQRMEALGRLAGGVAHDFNNVLTAITGHAELAREAAETDPEMVESLDTIIASAGTAASITKRLLAFGRRQVLQPEDFDLRELISTVESMVRPAMREDIRIVVDLPPRPVPLSVDRGQMEQAVVNLCFNARDAMLFGGELHLGIHTEEISDQRAGEDPRLLPGKWSVVTVRDTGSGMDDMTMAHLFEPFFSTKEVGKGTGLGLAMVHGFVTQSGGFITVESEPGRGTKFGLHMPLRGSLPSGEYAPLPPSATGEVGDAVTPLRILVVEDEPLVRTMAARMLQKGGYLVRTVGDPLQVEAILESDEVIDLVLTDFMMPGMDGAGVAEVVGRIRPGTPLVFMSGHIGDSDFLLLPPSDLPLIHKPFSKAELLEGVERGLKRGQEAVSAGTSEEP